MYYYIVENINISSESHKMYTLYFHFNISTFSVHKISNNNKYDQGFESITNVTHFWGSYRFHGNHNEKKQT